MEKFILDKHFYSIWKEKKLKRGILHRKKRFEILRFFFFFVQSDLISNFRTQSIHYKLELILAAPNQEPLSYGVVWTEYFYKKSLFTFILNVVLFHHVALTQKTIMHREYPKLLSLFNIN